jgi:hypothetical protein
MTNKQGPGAGDAEALKMSGGSAHLTESPKHFKLRGGRRSRDKGAAEARK